MNYSIKTNEVKKSSTIIALLQGFYSHPKEDERGRVGHGEFEKEDSEKILL